LRFAICDLRFVIFDLIDNRKSEIENSNIA